MKAFIFAAGKGVRMMPLTAERPKPMIEVAGKPLLQRILAVLPKEVTEIYILVGYKGDVIRQYFGQEFAGKKITYLEQKEQLGTGNALMLFKDMVAPGEKFLVVYADDLRDAETLQSAVANNELAVFVARVQYPERFGIVVTESDGRIVDMEEAPRQPKTDLAATGAYLLDADIFKYAPTLEPNGEYYINSMLLPYMRDHKVYAQVVKFWIPIGHPEDIKKAEEILQG